MPSLWDLLFSESGRVRIRRALLPALRPSSHYEKTCVIDGEVAFLGGLDIEQTRYDRPAHQPLDAWHDIACPVEGAVVRLV